MRRARAFARSPFVIASVAAGFTLASVGGSLSLRRRRPPHTRPRTDTRPRRSRRRSYAVCADAVALSARWAREARQAPRVPRVPRGPPDSLVWLLSGAPRHTRRHEFRCRAVRSHTSPSPRRPPASRSSRRTSRHAYTTPQAPTAEFSRRSPPLPPLRRFRSGPRVGARLRRPVDQRQPAHPKRCRDVPRVQRLSDTRPADRRRREHHLPEWRVRLPGLVFWGPITMTAELAEQPQRDARRFLNNGVSEVSGVGAGPCSTPPRRLSNSSADREDAGSAATRARLHDSHLRPRTRTPGVRAATPGLRACRELAMPASGPESRAAFGAASRARSLKLFHASARRMQQGLSDRTRCERPFSALQSPRAFRLGGRSASLAPRPGSTPRRPRRGGCTARPDCEQRSSEARGGRRGASWGARASSAAASNCRTPGYPLRAWRSSIAPTLSAEAARRAPSHGSTSDAPRYPHTRIARDLAASESDFSVAYGFSPRSLLIFVIAVCWCESR